MCKTSEKWEMKAMNKQELIKIMESLVMRYSNEGRCPSVTAFNAYSDALGWIKKLNEPQVTDEQAWNKIAEAYPESAQSLRNTLDNAVFGKAGEPQKPLVPKFVAEWFEENKDDLEFEIWRLCVDSYSSNTGQDMMNWIQQCENKPIETLINMKDGYVVEKEPLYTVTINVDRKYHLVVDEGDGNDEISTTLTTSHGLLGYRYFLTEKEIKSADENLWLIAVPAEQEEVE